MLKTAATFGWLCVETIRFVQCWRVYRQPPSGGCVLKLSTPLILAPKYCAATFGWLCVETFFDLSNCKKIEKAATFGWLCVETSLTASGPWALFAATFGWLCVETLKRQIMKLRAIRQPPSGGCVLKQLYPNG